MCALFIISMTLFYRYIYNLQTSDYIPHITSALNEKGYSLVGVLFFLCISITKTKLSIVILMSLVTVVTAIMGSWFMKKLLMMMNVETDFYNLIPISASSMFICKLCIPVWSPLYYEGAFSTQPWHNSTYTFMRLFGLCALIMFFVIQKDYTIELRIRDCLLFTLFMVLTNYSKPNFIIGFAPIVLIVLIYDFITSKGKTFKNAFLFGICILISSLILIYQYRILFPSNSNDQTIISISHGLSFIFKDYQFPLHFVLNYTFPLFASFYIIKNKRVFSNNSLRIFAETVAMLALSFLEYLFIVETGSRAGDGNYEWGLYFFSYIMFIVCICFIYKLKEIGKISDTKFTLLNYIYVTHIIFGTFYFVLLVIGFLSWRV